MVEVKLLLGSSIKRSNLSFNRSVNNVNNARTTKYSATFLFIGIILIVLLLVLLLCQIALLRQNFYKFYYRDNNFRLVCYYNFPTNNATLTPDKIDPFLCTHIIASFLSIQNNTLLVNKNENAVLKALVSLKSINPELKVLISVGGAGNINGFGNMVFNHKNRKAFIRSVRIFIENNDLDGIDLDWEYPNNDHDKDPKQKLHFTQLLEEFRMTIDRHSKKKFSLSLAAAAAVVLIDTSYMVRYVNQFVDFINLMSYDYHFYSPLTPFTGINSPLYNSSLDRGVFSSMNINYSIKYWRDLGMEESKINLGLPTFGHSFKLLNEHNNGLYAPASGFGDLGSGGFVDYPTVCNFILVNKLKPIFNLDTRSPYVSRNSEWISYDNQQSLKYKAQYIVDNNLGGAMVYSLNADDYTKSCDFKQAFPLINTIKNELFNATCVI